MDIIEFILQSITDSGRIEDFREHLKSWKLFCEVLRKTWLIFVEDSYIAVHSLLMLTRLSGAR